MRTGAAMTRFDSNLYPIGLMMVALLSLGLMVVQSVGPAEKGGRGIHCFRTRPPYQRRPNDLGYWCRRPERVATVR